MKTVTTITVAFAILFATPLVLACEYPASPKKLPDGATATKDEMLAGVKLIATYQEKMDNYLSCIEADEVVAMQVVTDDEDKTQRKVMFDKKYNAAVDEQTRTVELFNAEIRAYKARPDQ